MVIYLITLFGAMVFAYCAEHYPVRRNTPVKTGPDTVWVCLLIAFLVVISGFRYMNYYQSDEYNFRYMVSKSMGQSFDLSQIGLGKEWIFDVLIWISANVFHSDQALIFICALITNTLIIAFFAKYARPFWFAVFLYIATGGFFTSMNISRQYLAIAIIAWCYPLIKKRNFWIYLLLVIIASWLHQSAWVMLIAYPILRRKQFDLWTILIIIGACIVFISFEAIMSMILPNTRYDHYLEDIADGKYGVGWIRIAVGLVPAIIIIIFLRQFLTRFGVGSEILYAVILSACISVISSQYVFVARIGSYFSIVTSLATIRIPELFVKKDMRIIQFLMVALFFVFGLYQQIISPAYHNILFEEISGVL